MNAETDPGLYRYLDEMAPWNADLQSLEVVAVSDEAPDVKTFAEQGVTPGYHEGAAAIFRILAQTPFAAETRATLDPNRTMEETVRAAAKFLEKP